MPSPIIRRRPHVTNLINFAICWCSTMLQIIFRSQTQEKVVILNDVKPISQRRVVVAPSAVTALRSLCAAHTFPHVLFGLVGLHHCFFLFAAPAFGADSETRHAAGFLRAAATAGDIRRRHRRHFRVFRCSAAGEEGAYCRCRRPR